MTGIEGVADVVMFFRGAFSLIFALALAEGFKQTVHDKAEPTDRVLYLEKIPSLLGFLFLILPFYQGTIRSYGLLYADAKSLSPHYSLIIMFDSVSFLIEASIFFFMSRALSPDHWRSFYTAVVILLWYDTFWVWASTELHSNHPPEVWSVLNIVFGALAALMLYLRRGKSDYNQIIVVIGCMGLFVRAALDYFLSWNFYFPSVS